MTNLVANKQDLLDRLQQFEALEKQQVAELKQHAHQLVESFKPVNLVASTIATVAGAAKNTAVKGTLLNTAIGLGTDFISNKVPFLKKNNFLKNMLSNIVQFGTSLFLKKKIEKIVEPKN